MRANKTMPAQSRQWLLKFARETGQSHRPKLCDHWQPRAGVVCPCADTGASDPTLMVFYFQPIHLADMPLMNLLGELL